MAYRPILRVRVDWGGAVFWWQSPDSALARFGAAMATLQTQLRPVLQAKAEMAGVERPEDLPPEALEDLPEMDMGALPPEVLEALADMFVEGVVDWEGVEDEQGRPLRCDTRTRRAIPFADKVQVAAAYLGQTEAVALGKDGSPSAPSISTRPDTQTDAQ